MTYFVSGVEFVGGPLLTAGSEVLYVLFFIWLICFGVEKFSADYRLAGKLMG